MMAKPFYASAKLSRVAKRFVWPMLIGVGIVILPQMVDLSHFLADFFHSGTIGVILTLLAVVAGSIAIQWRPSTLRISDAGIDYQVGKRAYHFRWADITSVKSAKSGVRVDVRGRSKLRNAYNVIPDQKFGISRDDLCRMVNDYVESDGGVRQGQAAFKTDTLTSFTPADTAASIANDIQRVMMTFIAFMFVGGMTLLMVAVGQEYIKAKNLREHGQASQAKVVRFYSDSCGRNGCSINVVYTFRPVASSNAQIVEGRAYIASSRDSYSRDYQYARLTGLVPIVYDPGNPKISSLNFNGRVFRSNPAYVARSMLSIMGGIATLVAVSFAAVMWFAINATKRKLGPDPAQSAMQG